MKLDSCSSLSDPFVASPPGRHSHWKCTRTWERLNLSFSSQSTRKPEGIEGNHGEEGAGEKDSLICV